MRRIAASLIALWLFIGASPLSAGQDRQRMLDLLHISALRPGVSGNPAAPNAANYDESKAGPTSPLPEPLRFKDGRPVATPAQWALRRREILADFENEIYGHVPRRLPAIHWRVNARSIDAATGAVTTLAIGHAGGTGAAAIDIQLSLTLPPMEPGRRIPVVLQIGWNRVFPGMASTWREQVLAKHWGAAMMVATSVQPDDGGGLDEGIVGLGNHGKPRRPDQWGALRAWAWGASRALDYLATLPGVDARRLAIMGHSRYGKAALVAMAFDPRFAAAFISSSGAGGANLYRRNFGEQIENLASASEYHWFAGNFLKYAGPMTAEDLPVDSHELIALCAPRPVFIGAGATHGDGWVDARGMFLAEVSAGPVYRLLGARDLGTSQMPPMGSALTDGDLAFRQHDGGHTPEPNWPAFLAFAQRYLDKSP